MRSSQIPSAKLPAAMLSALLLMACGGGGGGAKQTASAVLPPADSSSGGAAPANAAPTIRGRPGGAVIVGQSYVFQPAASDVDGDTLVFSVANLPGWASFDAATGRVTGMPASADAGSYENIIISVSDGQASASLAPFTITVSETGAGAATVSWIPPTQNSDGSALTDLAGYQVFYGRDPQALEHSVRLDNPSLNSYMVENLGEGTWYFAVVAVNARGVSSPFSNLASKTIG